MFRRYGRIFIASSFCLFAISSVGCGSKEGGTVTPRAVLSVTGAVGSLNTGLSLFDMFAFESDGPQMLFDPLVGQTTSTSLKSLKYFVNTIELCQDVAINGTGYSGTTNCITIYESPDAASKSVDFYNNYTVSQALNDTVEGRWIDFMSAGDRAKLATPFQLSSDHIGTYRYGMIGFQRPIKITAEYVDRDGTARIFTKTPLPGDIKPIASDGDMKLEQVNLSTSTLTGTAQEMTLMHSNGGTMVIFHKPFEITEADIENKTELFVDFVFNPDQVSTASVMYAGCDPENLVNAIFDGANCVDFQVPMGKFAPVPRKSGETIEKEVYLVTNYYNGGADGTNNARIELYYNSADTAKSLQGIDMSVIANVGAKTSGGHAVYSYKSTEVSGLVTFFGYNQATGAIDEQTLTGLQRRQDGAVSITCGHVGHLGSDCTATGVKVSRTYTYLGTVQVSE
ncbi:MAG: hypothetical protein A2X94_05985 [Bdellovibrionales bacterium GWB1_55_8]|nr:MAG: hypothetical protein A2X94_05985 [Bdellovibrionales bacterium GWB1_55_8]